MEKWKIIPEYPNYAVSTLGEVMNVQRGNKLNGIVVQRGEQVVRLRHPIKTFRIHRLVATAFIPNPNRIYGVEHLDKQKHNNHVWNLKWYPRNRLEKIVQLSKYDQFSGLSRLDTRN